MKFIVDANIIFSGLLNTNGKIADLLINSKPHFEFVAPNFLKDEIRKHFGELRKLSHLTLDELKSAEELLYGNILFIPDEKIINQHWNTAYEMVADVDPNDTHYIAYAMQFLCKIWSGDKKLRDCL